MMQKSYVRALIVIVSLIIGCVEGGFSRSFMRMAYLRPVAALATSLPVILYTSSAAKEKEKEKGDRRVGVMSALRSFFSPASFPATSSSEDPEIQNPRTLHEVSDLCSRLTEMIQQQPQFGGHGDMVEQSKVLSLPNFDLCRIVEILSDNVNSTLGAEHNLTIRAFGNVGYYLYASPQGAREKIPLKQGISLWTEFNGSSCDVEKRRSAYESLVGKLSQGWVPARAEDFPDMLSKKDPNEWSLFIKPQADLQEEDTLMRFLAHSFGVKNKVSCYGYKTMMCKEGDTLCLWIAKDAHEDVAKVFNLPQDLRSQPYVQPKKIQQELAKIVRYNFPAQQALHTCLIGSIPGTPWLREKNIIANVGNKFAGGSQLKKADLDKGIAEVLQSVLKNDQQRKIMHMSLQAGLKKCGTCKK